jgi:hypothetical protein
MDVSSGGEPKLALTRQNDVPWHSSCFTSFECFVILCSMKLCPACDRHLFGAEPACPFCGAAQVTTSARQSGGAVASIALAFTLGTTACGPIVEPGQTDGSSSSVGDETTIPPATTIPPSTTGEPTADDGPMITTLEVGSSTSDDGDDNDDSPCAFYAGCAPDIDEDIYQCSVFDQDCPEGEKCMPWSHDGTQSWNATRCTPVADEPGAPGEPCLVEGSVYSGIDSCDVGVMCFDVDPTTNEGTCMAMCTGSVGDPQCAVPEQVCVLLDDEVPLCPETCHPLIPACEDGEGCYPAPNQEQFVCWSSFEGAGLQGDACEYSNACALGLTCVEASLFPACASWGCCTEYCDVTAGLPCPGADQGMACVPWYEDGMAPPGYETVGLCVLPP